MANETGMLVKVQLSYNEGNITEVPTRCLRSSAACDDEGTDEKAAMATKAKAARAFALPWARCFSNPSFSDQQQVWLSCL